MKKQELIIKGLEWILAFLVALIIIIIISIFVSQGKVSGTSMMPTYENGNRLFIQKQFYEIERGDVVTFWADKQEDKDNKNDITFLEKLFYNKEFLENKELHIKRVVALPNDTVKIKTDIDDNYYKSCVYVNDKKNMCSSQEIVDEKEYKLKENEYFVIGDNYDNSYDSRLHGPIKDKDIYGKVIFERENANDK